MVRHTRSDFTCTVLHFCLLYTWCQKMLNPFGTVQYSWLETFIIYWPVSTGKKICLRKFLYKRVVSMVWDGHEVNYCKTLTYPVCPSATLGQIIEFSIVSILFIIGNCILSWTLLPAVDISFNDRSSQSKHLKCRKILLVYQKYS